MKISFSKKSIPFAIFIFLSLTFGLLIYWQGFYATDWLALLASRLDNPWEVLNDLLGRWSLYPWVILHLSNLIGPIPILWQILSLLLRFITVLTMWWSLSKLWPGHIREVTWMAFLFAIYPLFDQQSVSVTNTPLWIAYVVYFLSLAAMIQSLRQERYARFYTALGLLGTTLHLLMLGYFIGLEFLRPAIIWFVSEKAPTRRDRIRFTTIKWIPYVLIILLTLIFQSFSGQRGNASYQSVASSATGQVAVVNMGWLQTTLRELVNLLFGAWNRTIEPAIIQLNDRILIISFVFAALIAGLVGFYWLHLKIANNKQRDVSLNNRFIKQAAVLGTLAFLMGIIPFWIDHHGTSNIYQSGYTLVAMFGLSILLVVFVEWAIEDQTRRIVFLCVLIGLAVGFHVRNANDFRWRWIDETRLYWQFYWRAPYLQPPTTIFSDSEFFKKNGGEAPATAAFNLLYPSTSDGQNIPFTFRFLNEEMTVIPASDSQTSSGGLVITYEPEQGNCLWVLSPLDSERPEVSRIARQSLGVVDLARIGTSPKNNWVPPAAVFGIEPDHTWCYYYQKAELARQVGDFKTVVKLAQEVQQAGYEPNNVQEWLPFIEGYARENRWEEAQRISNLVFQNQPSFSEWLCSSWKHFLEDSNPPEEDLPSIEKMLSTFQCGNIQK